MRVCGIVFIHSSSHEERFTKINQHLLIVIITNALKLNCFRKKSKLLRTMADCWKVNVPLVESDPEIHSIIVEDSIAKSTIRAVEIAL